jgi:hypothetical protein
VPRKRQLGPQKRTVRGPENQNFVWRIHEKRNPRAGLKSGATRRRLAHCNLFRQPRIHDAEQMGKVIFL